MTPLDEKLKQVMELHFDPRWGSAFWLERARQLRFDPRREIDGIGDLRRLGPMPLEAFAQRPVEDFIPRKHHEQLSEFILSETGGTTGPPKRTAFLPGEFEEAFVTPFVRAAELTGFPRGAHWLYLGPTGPHLVGKAVRACARALGSLEPFAVDFDPRWVRKLPPESMGRRRYIEHILAQAESILQTQCIGVLFATPPLAAELARRLPEDVRGAIQGVHLGGMAATAGFWSSVGADWFPNAKVMSGYGNSLLGVCPQLYAPGNGPPAYFPHGVRSFVYVHRSNGSVRGQVRFHRLDESCFLPNVHERDEAETIEAEIAFKVRGFHRTGILDPRPPESSVEAKQGGLY